VIMGEGPSTRSVVRITTAVAGTGFALYLICLLRGVVELIVLGVFVALWLGPFVEFLTRRRTPRVLAILAAYLTLFGSLVFLGLVVVPPIADQIGKGVRSRLASAGCARTQSQVRQQVQDHRQAGKRSTEAPQPAREHREGAVRRHGRGILCSDEARHGPGTGILSPARWTAPRRLANRIYRIRGPDQEERLRRLGTDIYRSVSGYVAGNIGISVIAGLVAHVALTAMGIAFAAPLAVIVGVFDLLPLVGATIAAIIVGVVTLFYSFPTDTIIWAIVVIVYQQIENNVLSPIVYRRTVQVPGMLVLVSVLVGATLRGVIGALLAIPVAAAIQDRGTRRVAATPRRGQRNAGVARCLTGVRCPDNRAATAYRAPAAVTSPGGHVGRVPRVRRSPITPDPPGGTLSPVNDHAAERTVGLRGRSRSPHPGPALVTITAPTTSRAYEPPSNPPGCLAGSVGSVVRGHAQRQQSSAQVAAGSTGIEPFQSHKVRDDLSRRLAGAFRSSRTHSRKAGPISPDYSSPDNVLVVTFGDDPENHNNAYQALYTDLKQLDSQGQIKIAGAAVVTHDLDGRVEVKSEVGNDPYIGTVSEPFAVVRPPATAFDVGICDPCLRLVRGIVSDAIAGAALAAGRIDQRLDVAAG